MIESNGLSFFTSFFAILWNFLVTTYVPCTNVPIAALLIGPFALSVLFASLDKILGFSVPGLFSFGHDVSAKYTKDALKRSKENAKAASD